MLDPFLLWLLNYMSPNSAGLLLAVLAVTPVAAYAAYDILTHLDE